MHAGSKAHCHEATSLLGVVEENLDIGQQLIVAYSSVSTGVDHDPTLEILIQLLKSFRGVAQ